jgi:predicted ATP-dependent endonuclease of OLD family
MKLTSVRVRTFKSILDSSDVLIQDDVTCIVGKNESGKSAFLNALYRLNPVNVGAKFEVQRNYPAWLEKRHRREGQDLNDAVPISATFALTEDELTTIAAKFGPETFKSTSVTVTKTYAGKVVYVFDTDESHAVSFILAGIDLPPDFKDEGAKAKTFEDLNRLVEGLKANGGENYLRIHSSIVEKRDAMLGKETAMRQAMVPLLKEFLPHFLYFDEYSSLRGTIKVRELLTKSADHLSEEEKTARALLTLAGTDDQYLLNPDYEIRKRELENVATSLTQDVLRYWTTNPELRVNIDIVQTNVNTPQGQQSVIDELKIRLWDDRHFLSLLLDERSTGFRWFFSFLAAFSEYEFSKKPLVILLDEPGLGLHAKAQRDLLKFIDERLAMRCQVVYTTHSPFLVQPGNLERVRLVEDKGREVGSKVTADVMSIDSDTLFPLQSALGYDLVQNLFISPHNLVVEGTSDYAYIVLMSEFLAAAGRISLDERWSIVPVGGADLIPTFVALLGNHLDLTVLLDSRKEGNQRLENLVSAKILKKNRLVAIGDIIGAKAADIEDLFATTDYISLYNAAFKTTLKDTDLNGTDAIVSRIARYLNAPRFDHGKPADYFLRNRDKVLPNLTSETLENFEKMFATINSTLVV